MIFRIDPASGVAIFDQLAASVRAELARGGLRAGERLPPAREVAAALEVNIHTVLKAYQLLRDEGVLELRRGRGAVIIEHTPLPVGLLGDLRGLVREAKSLGIGADTLTALVREEYTA